MAMIRPNETGLIGEKELAQKIMKLADIGLDKEISAHTKTKANELKAEIKREIKAKTGRHTGNLLRGVSAQRNKYAARNFPSYVVRMDWNKAPHSYLVEYGTRGIVRVATPKKTRKTKPGERWVWFSKELGHYVSSKKLPSGEYGIAPMPAKPYFRPVAYRRANSMNQAIKNNAIRVLDRIARQ